MNLVYTAIYGGYDKLWQPKVISEGWEYRIYSDVSLNGGTWKVIQQPLPYGAAKNSKYIKITHPMEHFENILWIDGCVEIKRDLNEFIKQLPKGDIVVGSHPTNRSLGSELRACIRMRKDDVDVMKKQVGEYGDFPIPDFPQNTIILRRKNIPAADIWWAEVKNKSKRDQLSFNWAMHKANQEYSTYPWSLAEKYFNWHKYHNK